MRTILIEGRSTGMKRDVYLTLVVSKVVIPVARELQVRAPSEREYNQILKQAGARVLRAAYSIG